ncbi:MAG TPA: hypothetical protein VH372_09130 [Actinospica sp.]|nr:hypothetical protein [Actinospica sp.]
MQELSSEAEPEDVVPDGWEDEVPALFLASTTPPAPTAPLLPIAGKTLAYVAAGGWPFLWAWIEFLRLNAAHAVDTDMCSDAGCSQESHIFLQQDMSWFLLASCISVVVMAGLLHLRPARRAGRPKARAGEAPVSRLLLVGLFATACTLAFLIGILRGVIISRLGH